MKKIGILFAACFLFAASGQSQIINSTQPETPVAGTVVNTGLAIAPFYHWQAMAYDDPSLSNYTIEWRDDTGILLDVDNQAGHNPDVGRITRMPMRLLWLMRMEETFLLMTTTCRRS